MPLLVGWPIPSLCHTFDRIDVLSSQAFVAMGLSWQCLALHNLLRWRIESQVLPLHTFLVHADSVGHSLHESLDVSSYEAAPRAPEQIPARAEVILSACKCVCRCQVTCTHLVCTDDNMSRQLQCRHLECLANSIGPGERIFYV